MDAGAVMMGLMLVGIAVLLSRQEREAVKAQGVARRVNQIARVMEIGCFDDEDDDDGDDDEDEPDIYTGPRCDKHLYN